MHIANDGDDISGPKTAFITTLTHSCHGLFVSRWLFCLVPFFQFSPVELECSSCGIQCVQRPFEYPTPAHVQQNERESPHRSSSVSDRRLYSVLETNNLFSNACTYARPSLGLLLTPTESHLPSALVHGVSPFDTGLISPTLFPT